MPIIIAVVAIVLIVLLAMSSYKVCPADRVMLTSSPRLKPGDSLHGPDSEGTSGLWEEG